MPSEEANLSISLTPDSVKALLESADFGDRLRGVNQLRELDPSVAFTLIKPVASDSNARVRYAAVSQISTLGATNPAEALPLLRHCLLTDSEIDVRAAAADSLGALQLTEAFADLQAVYENTDEWLLQFSIIAALGELGESQAFDLLATALTSENELVRTAAIGSLGELNDARAVPLLVPLVSDDDWQLRHRLVQALKHFATPEAKAALATLAQDDNEVVANEAKSA